MPKYVVCWTEAVSKSVVIEAESPEEAVSAWDNDYYDLSTIDSGKPTFVDDSAHVRDENGDVVLDNDTLQEAGYDV